MKVTNRIYLPISISPWEGLRSFIAKNRDVFDRDSRTSFKVGLHDTKHDISDVFDIDFRKFSGHDDVFIMGESDRSPMKTSIKMDPQQEKGKIIIPQFGGSVILEGNKYFLEENEKTSPLFSSVAELYIKFYWRVLDHIVNGEDKPIDDALNSIRMRKYNYS